MQFLKTIIEGISFKIIHFSYSNDFFFLNSVYLRHDVDMELIIFNIDTI